MVAAIRRKGVTPWYISKELLGIYSSPLVTVNLIGDAANCFEILSSTLRITYLCTSALDMSHRFTSILVLRIPVAIRLADPGPQSGTGLSLYFAPYSIRIIVGTCELSL